MNASRASSASLATGSLRAVPSHRLRARGGRLARRAAPVGLLLALGACAPRPLPAPAPRPAYSAPAPAYPEERLAALLVRTERARGLGFPAPVGLRMVAVSELRDLLERQLSLVFPPEAMRRAARLGQAIGLLPPDVDLARTLLDFQGDAVAGFYTPLDDRLHLVVDDPERGAPEVAEDVVVHELTHALQAVHSSLLDVVLGLDEWDDLEFALGALLEGDATLAAFRDGELEGGGAPPSPERFARLLGPEAGELDYPHVPRAVRERFLLQYTAGYALARALEDAGGLARLDAALVDPPLSSEQVLHPERFLDAQRRDVPRFLELPRSGLAPDARCEELQRDTLGEIGLQIWLRVRLGPGVDAAQLARGWGGDRLVVFDCPDGLAFAWLLRFDAPEDQVRFHAAARQALTGLEAPARLRGTPRTLSGASGLLLSAGLDATARAAALERSTERSFRDLEAFLGAHPEVAERAARLRERAASQGSLGRPGLTGRRRAGQIAGASD